MEDNEEEDVLKAEDNMSASEDEGGSDDDRKHSKLLEAISSLGRNKRKKLAERTEASVQVSEFTVTSEGAGEKINLSDLLGLMNTLPTPAGFAKTKRQLKNLKNSRDTLELPLSRQQAEKIQRVVAYDKTANEVSRWQPVVSRNERAEQLVFPLNQQPSGPRSIEHVVARWKTAQTPLEEEIFSLLHKNKQPIQDPVLTPKEEASLKAMSLEEAKIRRAELQKARVLQSYYEAKAKRERSIKSKKYHRIQNKAKRKDFLKRFDEMVKTDPSGALEELKKMEMSRVQERMSLKHQNSGKWAKSKAIMAKYDEGARKAMQQQLEMNKELTQKMSSSLDKEEEEEEEEEEVLPDFVNDAEQPLLDGVNPWMRGKLSAEPEGSGDLTPGDATPGVNANLPDEEELEEDEEEQEEGEEETLLKEFEERRRLRRKEDSEEKEVQVKDGSREREEEDCEIVEIEEEEVSELNSRFHRLQDVDKGGVAANTGTGQRDDQPLLEEGLVRLRTLEDMEQLPQDVSMETSDLLSCPTPVKEGMTSPPTAQQKNKKKRKNMIDPNEVLKKKGKVIKVPLVPTAVEDEEGEEQRLIIKEAFAGDDVVSDFLKDKKNQEVAGQPKVVDLTLPGWGEWGGLGLKPSRRKRGRFLVKPPPPPPRQDQKLPNVIISEKRDSTIAAHQVSHLPFPFENPAQFERTIRSPVGHTWNTQKAVQKMTVPRVVTQMGAIIDPMAREDFLKDKRALITGAQADIALSSTPAHKRGHKTREKTGKQGGLKTRRRSRCRTRNKTGQSK